VLFRSGIIVAKPISVAGKMYVTNGPECDFRPLCFAGPELAVVECGFDWTVHNDEGPTAVLGEIGDLVWLGKEEAIWLCEWEEGREVLDPLEQRAEFSVAIEFDADFLVRREVLDAGSRCTIQLDAHARETIAAERRHRNPLDGMVHPHQFVPMGSKSGAMATTVGIEVHEEVAALSNVIVGVLLVQLY
jgi:hypothetical protein